MTSVAMHVSVNGQGHELDVEPRLLLVHLLRDQLGLTGTHVGCDTTNCGACTVHLDGEAVKSCTVFAVQADGARSRRSRAWPTATTAPAAGGVLEQARPAVRLLHPGHDHGRGRPAAAQSATRPSRRSATASRATSAAAPATTTSCARCRRPPRSTMQAAPRRRLPARPAARRRRSWRERGWGHEHDRAVTRRGQRTRRALAAPQGGPAADHRPRHLRRRHRRCRACCGRRFVRSPEAHARIVSIDTVGRARARGRGAPCSPARTWRACRRRCRWPGCRPGSRSTPPSTGRWPRTRSTTSATRWRWSIGDDRYA